MTLYRTIATIDGGINVEMTAEEIAIREAEEATHLTAQPRLDILAKIANLEAQQTPRRIREHLLNPADPFLADLDAQISSLRASL